MSESPGPNNRLSNDRLVIEVTELSKGMKGLQSAMDFIEKAPIHEFSKGMMQLQAALDKTAASFQAVKTEFDQASDDRYKFKTQLEAATAENRKLAEKVVIWDKRLKESQGESRKKEEEFSKLIEKEHRELVKKDDSLKQLRKDMETLKAEAKAKDQEYFELIEKKQRELEKKDDSLLQLENEKEETEAQIQIIQEELETVKQQNDAAKEQLDTRERKVIELKNRNEQLTSNVERLEGEVGSLSRSLKGLESERNRVSESLASISGKNELLKKEKQKLAVKVEERERMLSAMKDDLGTMGKKREGFTAELSKVNDILREKEEELEHAQIEHAGLTGELERLLAREKELEDENARERTKVESLMTENEQLSSVLGERNEIIAQLSSASEKVTILDQITNSTRKKINEIRENLIKKKESIIKNKEDAERKLNEEMEKNMAMVREDVRHSNEILQEFFENSMKVLVNQLEEIRTKKKKIEEDLANMTPEFRKKYGDYVYKDLTTTRNKEMEAEKKLGSKINTLIQQLPEHLQKGLSREVLQKGKIETIFEEENSRIREMLQKREQEIENEFGLKKKELYQRYLKDLGEIYEKALKGKIHQINALPEEKKLLNLGLHELEESLREIDKSKRIFVLELKKKMDDKKMDSLEQKLSLTLQSLETEKSGRGELEKEIEDLRKDQSTAEAVISGPGTAEEEWKEQYESEVRERLEKEVRERLEKELRVRLEMEIRDELVSELKKQEEEAIARKKAVKKVMKAPTPKGRLPFVRCPSCSTKIEVRSKKRPLLVKCPECESEYTLMEKSMDKRNRENGNRQKKNSGSDGITDRASQSMPDHLSLEDIVLTETKEGDEAIPPRPPSPVEPEEEKSMKPQEVSTKEITCPYCKKIHIVPTSLSKRFTCSCGRRIRTI